MKWQLETVKSDFGQVQKSKKEK